MKDRWMHLPDMRAQFRTDIINNITTLTRDFTRDIFLPDLEESAVMYAADMILNYRNESGKELVPHVITEIVNQVNDVYEALFAGQYSDESKERCMSNVRSMVSNPLYASNTIRNYYAKVDSRY